MGVKIQEVNPIVKMSLGGCPPTQRGMLWLPVMQELQQAPEDGTWLQVQMRSADDVARCAGTVRRWWLRNRDVLDCSLEVRCCGTTLWLRKSHQSHRKGNGE